MICDPEENDKRRVNYNDLHILLFQVAVYATAVFFLKAPLIFIKLHKTSNS